MFRDAALEHDALGYLCPNCGLQKALLSNQTTFLGG